MDIQHSTIIMLLMQFLNVADLRIHAHFILVCTKILSIQILAIQTGPEIASHHSIHVDHRHNMILYKIVSIFLDINQLIKQSLHND